MSVKPKATTPDDTVWPPAPTLPPPIKAPLLPWLVRLPASSVVLVDMGIGLAEFGFTCLRQWVRHRSIQWIDAGTSGVIMFLTFLVLHFRLRSWFLKRERKAAE